MFGQHIHQVLEYFWMKLIMKSPVLVQESGLSVLYLLLSLVLVKVRHCFLAHIILSAYLKVLFKAFVHLTSRNLR